MWGAEDLVAALGGNSSRRPTAPTGTWPRHVRSPTLLAAKAHGRFALDSVYLDIEDLDGLRARSLDAVAVGFDAKVAIHPRQVAVIRRRMRRPDDQIEWARQVLAAAADQRGVFAFEGRDGRCAGAAACGAMLRRAGEIRVGLMERSRRVWIRVGEGRRIVLAVVEEAICRAEPRSR